MSSHAGRQTWTAVRLGDVGRIVSGATPRTDNPAYWEGDILWVTPKDLSGHDTAIITETGKAITAAGLASCSAEQLPVGTVLFSSRAPIGLTAITGAPMATNQGFKSVVPGPGIDSHFLYWALRHFGPSIAKRAPGTTFKEVNKAAMEDVRIPLPPLSEQRRVAALLDKADAIRRKRQQAIRLADDLLRSAFLDMFGDIPAGRSRYPFGSVREWVSARSGKSSKEVSSPVATGIPIFGGNGPNGWATRALYQQPVVVVGRVGQQCAITHLTDGPAWVTDNAIVVEVTNSERLDPMYLAAAWQHSAIRVTVERLDLPFINQDLLLDYPIPLPPISQQLRFVRTRSRVVAARERYVSAQSLSDHHFDSLVQRAFRGDL